MDIERIRDQQWWAVKALADKTESLEAAIDGLRKEIARLDAAKQNRKGRKPNANT